MTPLAPGRAVTSPAVRSAGAWLALATLPACGSDSEGSGTDMPEERIFAAVEADGALAILDGSSGALLATVDLSETHEGETTTFAAHNVQTAPDGERVWITAIPYAGGGGHEHGDGAEEQLVGIDAHSFEIVARIPLGASLHAAHVVLSPETAYVTATDANEIVVVDLADEAVARTIALPEGTGPHGARLTPDGRTLVVAGMGDGSLHLVAVADGSDTAFDLPGRAVQTAVTPDGRYAFASVYDTRQLARLELASRELVLLDLPDGSAGPIQLYPHNDSGSVWVADQGMVGGEPAGSRLYRIAVSDGALLVTAEVDPAPHGVVVNQDGSRVWTTTLVRGTVQSVDPETGAVLSTTVVGEEPNGISCRHEGGAMP